MDLNSGLLITCSIVHMMPVTNNVIKAVKAIAYKQGFKGLKFKNQHKDIFHDADWIAGVDYDDNKLQEDEYHPEVDQQYDKNKNELKECDDRIDPQEVDDLISDAREEVNPSLNVQEPELEGPGQAAEHNTTDTHEVSGDKEESPTSKSRRST